ncbi:SDR family oxidoreductase [soil metagenome]
MFRGKVVLITGAARGIGASMARLLHQRGALLVLIDVDESGLRALSNELGGETVACIGCDVNDFDAMHAAANTAAARFGAIDIVVANAGTEHWAPVRTVEPDVFRRVIETNVIGVFNTVRVALPSVIERRGYILVVASVSSYTAVPGMASYGASKAGVEQFANVLRMELAHHGVAVGSAHMSLVDTPMLRETQAESTAFTKLLAALPAPLRRPVTADKCAERLVDAIGQRRRYVDVPRWVAATRWLKPVLSTALAQRPMTQQMSQIEAWNSTTDIDE